MESIWITKAKAELAARATKNECCERCNILHFSPNVEAFEISGEILCDECAEEVFEDNGQFGVDA